MSTTFRVEAFIIPSLNREIPSKNLIDDVKVAKLLRDNDFSSKLECIQEDSEHSDHSILEKSSENFTEHEEVVEGHQQSADYLNEPIYDVPFSCREKLKNKDKNIETNVGVKCSDIEENINTSNSTDFVKLEINYSESDEDANSKEIPAEPVYDIPYLCGRNQQKPSGFIKKLETAEFSPLFRNEQFRESKMPLQRLSIRSSSLMSIDERGETPEDCVNQFCQHGFKNGCTAITQRPEQVTEKIFEFNWMRRLENLRAREAVIKEKEAMLFDRERLLFKKEKELRILERLLKDKLKHIELSSKRFKHPGIESEAVDEFNERSEDSQGFKQNLERSLGSLETLGSTSSVQTILSKSSNVSQNTIISRGKNSRDSSNKMGDRNIGNSLTEKIGREGMACASVTSESSTDGKIINNPPNSRSSLMTSNFAVPLQPDGLIHSSKGSIGYSGYTSMTTKRKPKMSYDDLDSTLSADIGDSSFVVTSRIFNPAVIKKPRAFTRTFSERKPHIEGEKVLKRLSENIFVSKNSDTRFQNYGMIDLGRIDERIEDNDKRCSYLNLEKGHHKGKEKVKKDSKERPVSWSEEQNEWLQRKRMAYNCTMRRIPNERFDKENLQKKCEMKKKVSMVKKFSIFR
uniref:Uncharacterized protein n=1 Tax=Fopius arisanus TaxID=64838 RepID=A0A0C9RZG3_9HYME